MEGRELEVVTMRKVSRRLIPYLLVLYVAAAAAGAIAVINSLAKLAGFFGPYLIGRVRDLTSEFVGSLITMAVILVGSSGLAVRRRRSPANDNEVREGHLEGRAPKAIGKA